jgi:hypothetical protein
MLMATFARVNEEDLPRLREWLGSLSERRAELRESYRQQQTRHELFFLIRTERSPLLILISEVADPEQASSSFLRSNLPIDVEFKNLVQDIARAEGAVELLYDSSDFLGVAAA